MNSVGERLKRCRELAGLSQGELAEAIGASRSAIAQVELGISNSLNAENLAKAARKLGKSAVWLSSGEGHEDGFDIIGEALSGLSGQDRQQVFDFILYKVERAGVPYVQQNASSYSVMIQRLTDDMNKRRSKDDGTSRSGSDEPSDPEG